MSEITTNANGMLGMTLAVTSLSGGRKYWTRLPATPMSSATITAMGRLRRRAAITAANAAAMSRVNLSGVEADDRRGEDARRARRGTLPPSTRRPRCVEGLLPESDVIASESTIARTLSPASVKRRISAPITTMASTHAYAMTWSRVTAVPNTVYTSTGCGASPGARKISVVPKMMLASGGIITERPMVTTTLISCDDSRRNRKIAM